MFPEVQITELLGAVIRIFESGILFGDPNLHGIAMVLG